MKLSAKILKNVININSWQYTDQAEVYQGSVNEVYFQLVDLSKTAEINPKSTVLPDNPLRYMSESTSLSVSVLFPNIDTSKQIEVVATQPFSDDKSIWKVTLTSSQTPSSGSFRITLTEDGISKTFNVMNAISVNVTNWGGC